MILLLVWVGAFFFSNEPATDLIDTIATASGPTFMAIAIVGVMKGWWVPGPTHQRALDRLDKMLDVQAANTQLQSRTVAVAENRMTLAEELARLTEIVKGQEGGK